MSTAIVLGHSKEQLLLPLCETSTNHRFLGRFGVCADKSHDVPTPNVPQKIVDA